MTYRDEIDLVFGRLDDAAHVMLLYETDGLPVTRIDANVYPIGSELSARYEHPAGITLSREDAEGLGIAIEDAPEDIWEC